jgi:alpha-1,3-rhamnosyl/mannosyltransferase
VQVREVQIRHMTASAQWRLPEMVRTRRHDVFHYPHFDLPFLTPGPLVVTLHDLKYLARPDFFPRLSGARRLVMRAMMLAAVRKARRVIVDSESTHRDVLHILRADPSKLRVVPLGVEAHYFNPPTPSEAQVVRETYGLEGDYILCVAERRPHKNLPALIRAFNILRKEHGYTQLELALAGAAYQDYREPERTAQALGLSDAVRFIDRPPDAHLPALYAGARAFALLSEYEGFGLPVLEAMACGVPVVAANATSLPEVVGDAGRLVQPNDAGQVAAALDALLRDGPQREDAIARGKAQARRFTWKATAMTTLQVYQEAIEMQSSAER